MVSTCWVSWVFFLLPSLTFSFLQESIHFTIFHVHYLCSISLLQPSLPLAGQTRWGQACVPGAVGGAAGLQSRKETHVRPLLSLVLCPSFLFQRVCGQDYLPLHPPASVPGTSTSLL